jgi:heptosyltransferase I
LDEIIIFDRKFLGKVLYNYKAMGSLLALIKKLRDGKFDIVLDLQGLFRTASLGWLSGCKKRFGMAKAGEFAHLFYTNKISQDKDSIHLVDYYLKIAQAAGASDTMVQFVLPKDSAAFDSVSKLLRTNNIDSKNYAVLVPGSAHKDKCWPVERFAALGEIIAKKWGFSIIVTGTASEKVIGDKLVSVAKTTIANFVGLTNISQLIALLKGAKLVISNDTGPGHIATALGVPLVIIFGRSNPARVAPYGKKNSVAAIDPDGRGFNSDSSDPKHNIKAVTIEEVYQKVCAQIEQISLQKNSV